MCHAERYGATCQGLFPCLLAVVMSSFRVRVKRDEASLCGGRMENGFAQAICNDFITKNRPSGGCEIEGEWDEKVEMDGCF